MIRMMRKMAGRVLRMIGMIRMVVGGLIMTVAGRVMRMMRTMAVLTSVSWVIRRVERVVEGPRVKWATECCPLFARD